MEIPHPLICKYNFNTLEVFIKRKVHFPATIPFRRLSSSLEGSEKLTTDTVTLSSGESRNAGARKYPKHPSVHSTVPTATKSL